MKILRILSAALLFSTAAFAENKLTDAQKLALTKLQLKAQTATEQLGAAQNQLNEIQKTFQDLQTADCGKGTLKLVSDEWTCVDPPKPAEAQKAPEVKK